MVGEWANTTLGEVIELKRGYDLPTTRREVGEVPVVSSSGISGLHNVAMVRGPGVVTGRYGTIGEVFYIERDFWPLNTTLYVRDFKGANPRFVSYFLRQLDFQAYTDKAAVPGINRNDVHRAEVLWPPRAKQDEIAALLSSLDDKIALNRHTAATLEEMARTLFKSWFVDFDPTRAKIEGRGASLSQDIAALFPERFGDDGLPEGWAQTTFRDVCEVIFSGGTPSTTEPQYWGGNLPWLSSGETGKKFILRTDKTITEKGVANSSTRLARAGNTVIASAGQGNTRGQTAFLLLDTYINQSVVVLSANPSFVKDHFLFFDLERRYEEFRQISDGQSSRGSLTTKLVAGVKTTLPPIELVEVFETVAADLVNRVSVALREAGILAELRDTLLPKLISGELRIRDAEKAVAA